MANDKLKNLRLEVRKRRSAVTAKENRIKRNTGVDIRNTREDPRRPVNVVNRYNARQLNTYLADLNSFMSRSTGFVSGAGNVPISKSDWFNYKRLEKKFNSVGAKHFESIADIEIGPKNNMSIRDRDKLMVPDHKRAQGEIVHRPYGEIDRKSTNIKGAEALAKLSKQLEKKLAKNFLPEALNAGRKQANQMLVLIGNSDLTAKLNKLNDYQFNVLWNYTDFATGLSVVADSDSARRTNVKEDRYQSTVVEGFSDDIRKFLGWAETVSEESAKRAPSRSGKTSRTQSKKKR